MENGHGGKLADKLSGLRLNQNDDNNNNSDSLFQVEENNRLRTELHNRIQQLEKYKSEETTPQRPHSDPWHRNLSLPEERMKSMGNTSPADPSGPLVLHRDPKPNSEDAAISETSKNNGAFKGLSAAAAQTHADTLAPSQLSSPSTSFSPTRYQIDGEYDPRFNLSGQGLMPMAEVNNSSSLWKQDLVVKIREHEEEILQLRKHLAEYSIKEAQIQNEKYVLEKRIAYMRLAFDQQQQDLVDAASKALSYRQDIIEENIHLTYQLQAPFLSDLLISPYISSRLILHVHICFFFFFFQAAQQERSTFVQSLLPLLAEYSLQPPVPDAQSIVSNVKVLFKHLQEKLIFTESKLKESQYQLAPWRSDLNHSSVAPQSPTHFNGAALDTSNKNGLELVPQPTYSHGKLPTTSDAQVATNWELLGHHQGGLGGVIGKNLDDDMRRYSPLASRNPASQDMPAHFASTQDGEETVNKQVKFSVPVNNSEMDDPDVEEHQNERDHSSNWASGNPPYNTNLDDPNSSYPYLPPVLEEPSSSFSEAADDDALPLIEGLQITGEAFPGRQLQACGYSINGTTSCNFEWVRHLEDGSVNYIDGAKQPTYLVTADDVDTYLAIEVQPLDDRKRKLHKLWILQDVMAIPIHLLPACMGELQLPVFNLDALVEDGVALHGAVKGELVKVFANEHRKIICDPEMQNYVEKTLYGGHASYKVSLSTGYLDIWEPATLAIKREGYSIKCSGTSSIITEKFSSTTVSIPYGTATEFLIIGSGGDGHLLRADSSATDVSWLNPYMQTIFENFKGYNCLHLETVYHEGRRKEERKEEKYILSQVKAH
ncbi:hypothetical protein EZV62_015280 [Acer yangbiense]|uniref:DUF7046 domain-containing protein n=1 Tax=Acer yangbiense TaxID=1000413 RepID=A0A5C7HUD9_9ROSI|nr:hypothetical protein EZV62_015280 [Acer yangbiense]